MAQLSRYPTEQTSFGNWRAASSYEVGCYPRWSGGRQNVGVDTEQTVVYITDMAETIFSLHTYTPAEAERVTGVTVTMQRDWRRHGHIPASESAGHTRYDIVHLANLIVMRALSGHVALKDAKAIAYWAKNRVLKEALERPTVWQDYSDEMDLGWQTRMFIQQHVKDGRVIPGKMLIIFADGSESFQESVDVALGKMTLSDPKTQGALVVIDLERMGARLAAALASTSPLAPIAIHPGKAE
jgi:hypothetical protein